MSGEFSVSPSDLRRARTALDGLGRLNVDVSAATGVMHDVVLPEAAGLLQAVAEKASKYLTDVGKLVEALSAGLGAAAKAYETADDHVAGSMGGPR
jgi:hypothetical protein